MPNRLWDVDLLKALPYTKGDDREVLILALGESEGTEGPAQLRALYTSETGHARSAALSSLARRCGGAATDVLSEALRSRSSAVQWTAALELAEHGTAGAADAVFEWLDRKLGRKRREATWDPYELPNAIRFAVRHGLQAEVARIIVKHWSVLHQDEQRWLQRTWPSLFDGGSPAAAANVPPPSRVQYDVYEDERGLRANERSFEDTYGEYVRKALRTAERRRLRSKAG